MNRSSLPISRWLLALAFALAACCSHAAPQSGWWWNPAESGRGFFIEIVGDWMFFSGYFYAEDGRPTWLVSNDPMPAANFYEGRLLAFAGGQSLVGGYRAPGGPAIPGNVRLTFTDDTHAIMVWPGGTVALERQPFQGAPLGSFRPQTGWWWNPNESGRGFSIEMQGGHMFVGAYLYDEVGNPVWYVADAMMTTATRFAAPLLRFSGGQTLTGAYRRPGGPEVVGTLTMDFSAPDRATVRLTDAAPGSSAAKQFVMFEVETQKKKPVVPIVDRPYYYDGGFRETTRFQTNAVITITSSITFQQSFVTHLDGSTDYEIQVGTAFIKFEGNVDQGDEKCPVTASAETPLGKSHGSFNLQPGGAYSGVIKFPISITLMPCGKPLPISQTITIDLNGKNGTNESILGGYSIPGSPSIDTSWQFFGRE